MPDPDIQHEASDVNFRGVLGFAVGLVAVAAAIHLMVWVLFQYFAGREAARVTPQYPLAAGLERRVPPEPRLQTNPRGDLAELRAREEEVLYHYGWVDKHAGIVRIPIEEAMKITLQRGLPTRQVSK